MFRSVLNVSARVNACTSIKSVQLLGNRMMNESRQYGTSLHPKWGGSDFQEIVLTLSDGTTIAGQQWLPSSPQGPVERNILCLHGWLDNCRSFYHLAPALSASLNANVIALDLPGHGRSSHKPDNAPPTVLPELTYYISDAVDTLRTEELFVPTGTDDQRFSIVGHSMGAGISSWYTACFPEEIDQMVLLDGVGFMTLDVRQTAKQVRRHVERRKVHAKRLKEAKPPKFYDSLDKAIERRIQTAHEAPGNQTMSQDAAREIVLRATHLDIPSENAPGWEQGPVRFRHDTKFTWPSVMYTTEEQNQYICQTISESDVDACVLMAKDGWPFGDMVKNRVHEKMKPREFHWMDGSHHFHADTETRDTIADTIIKFFTR